MMHPQKGTWKPIDSMTEDSQSENIDVEERILNELVQIQELVLSITIALGANLLATIRL